MEKIDYIKEKDLTDYPSPISSDKLETILEQIKKCICDIKCPIEGHGTGFFCRIPYPDFFNIKPVLMTNNLVLGKEDILQGKKIKFALDKGKIQKEIKITNKRKVYTNQEYDITIIELDPKEDSIESDSFLDVDSKFECDNPNNEFKNKDIYIIGNIKDFTYGKIKIINEDGINIKHLCSTDPGMSGSPIINLNTFRVIGIHKGADPNKQYNLGTFLREPLKQFYSLKNESTETVSNTISPINAIFQSDIFNFESTDLVLSKFENDPQFDIIKNLKIIQSDLIMDSRLTLNMLDPRGNKYEGWGVSKKKGGFDYHPPIGWIGFGLNVKEKYDDGDDSWIENDNSGWCIGYHGVNPRYNSDTIKRVIPFIINGGFKAGLGQRHSHCEDIYHPGQKIGGNGVYFCPKINIVKEYAGTIDIKGISYKVAFMARIKSSRIRACIEDPDIWIVNGNYDEVRPYRILLKKNKFTK